MNLDCETPVGRAWIARQRSTVNRCAAAWCVEIAAPPEPSRVDALISRCGALLAVAEVKSRDLSFAALKDHGTYLVTFEKLNAGREIAQCLHVPYLLIVGLSDAVVYWQISDALGEWCAPMSIERTETQATSNGGTAERANAFVPFLKSAGAHSIEIYPACLPPLITVTDDPAMLTAGDIPF